LTDLSIQFLLQQLHQ